MMDHIDCIGKIDHAVSAQVTLSSSCSQILCRQPAAIMGH